MADIYLSSYCNHGHDLATGKPVNHECVILPVDALLAERDGDFETANEIIFDARPLKTHRGVKR